MSETMQLYTGLSFVTALFLVAASVLVLNNHIIQRRERNTFTFGLLGVVLVLTLDWFSAAFDGAGPGFQFPNALAVMLSFSIAPFIPVAIAQTIYPDKATRIVQAVLAGHALLELVNLAFGFIFYVDAQAVYHRGSLYLLYTVAYVISASYLVIQSLRAARTYQTVGKRGIAAIVACLSSGVIIQFLFSNIYVAWTAVAMAVVLYILFYIDMTLCTDPLTNLLNRRSYEAFLANPTTPCVVISIDVNDFKHVNDTYGHAAGDHCLTTIAHAVRRVFEGVGKCYRSGGDEYVVVVTKRLDQVDALIALLYSEVANEHALDERIPSVSVGFARAEAGCDDIGAVVHEADLMMYEQKALHKVGR